MAVKIIGPGILKTSRMKYAWTARTPESHIFTPIGVMELQELEEREFSTEGDTIGK